MDGMKPNGRRLAILTGLLALAVVGVTAYLGWTETLRGEVR